MFGLEKGSLEKTTLNVSKQNLQVKTNSGWLVLTLEINGTISGFLTLGEQLNQLHETQATFFLLFLNKCLTAVNNNAPS